MIRKRIFTLLTAAFMVLAFTAMAIAANNVRLTTTVPNIPKSTCYQAGTITMEMDSFTAISEGDVIQFTLNNKVTSCKALNMWLKIASTAGALDVLAGDPVSTSAGAVTAAPVGFEWGFLITAINADTVAGQIITLQMRLRDITGGATDGQLRVVPLVPAVMTFTGTLLTDKLFVKLFDGKIAGTANSGFFETTALAPTVYKTVITADDNMICIDTLTADFPDEYVQATPDSLPLAPANELIFSGDYRIAHIMATVIESIVPCGGKAVGHIEIGAQGQPDTCESFDFETAGTVLGNGYCTDHLAGNHLIIASSGTFVPAANYVAKMQIIVERAGVAKAIPGVYWSNQNFNHITGTAAAGLAGICAAVPASNIVPTWLRSDGVTASVAPRAPGVDCDLTLDQKAVYLTAAGVVILAGQSYINIDLPQFNYVLDEIQAGDVVKIRVTLTSGCTTIGALDITIGTFGCVAGPVVGSMVACPYVTTLAAWDPAAGGTYWNGIAITNYNNADGTVNLTAYINDGTTATASVSIPANGLVVSYVSDLAWVGTIPDGVPAWIKLESADIPAGFLDAFIMMSDNTSQSMGYLCR